jgi:hypothetical protein
MNRPILVALCSLSMLGIIGCNHKDAIPQVQPSRPGSMETPATPAQVDVSKTTKFSSPVTIGHTELKIAELSDPVQLELQYYPYTEDEEDFSPDFAFDGLKFFTKLVFKEPNNSYEITSKYTLMSLKPPHHPRRSTRTLILQEPPFTLRISSALLPTTTRRGITHFSSFKAGPTPAILAPPLSSASVSLESPIRS